ncbi:MAG: PorP/SprF family type IX secretion system membrane protein [Chitinophaga sp.]|uniref:PorP/SprF family type IX secretion system membrane protein n=1 Tax=Chitinophaga sp. TaxID=1869181 RepID=UPI001AFEF7B5|nr:PorP/SprF family type IX secretion system membrane protein [Chitinophaga sp.]MBO9732724.1 PorP/SprF family type IX secretion system membrane protein [Chitinophaga sp.]
MRFSSGIRFYSKYISLLVLAMAGFLAGGAQSLSNTPALLEPSATQYFQNQYLANPAMAGIDSGLHLNAAYRRQMNGIDGAPISKFFTADGYIGARVGGGVHIFNDQAGLMNRTRVALSYAYHLPLGDRGQTLHLGLSLAMNFQRIDYKAVNGDGSDPSIGAFNRRDNYFEGEFGMAYTNTHWNIQGSLPNIRTLFTGDNKAVDGGTIYFTAISYKFLPEGAISSIIPKVCYRGVRGYDNIFDFGLHAGFLHEVANVMALYHTSGSFTGGLGVNILQTVTLQAMYTTQTNGMKTYVDGGYEIGLTVNLFRR